MVMKIIDIQTRFGTKGFENINRQMEKLKNNIKKQNLDIFARKFNKLGGVMGMGMQEFKKFDDGTGRLNKRMMKQLGVTGRLGMRIRWLTHGFRGFRMELLGVMFFGMGIQKFFTGLIKPALTVTGVFKLWSTILTILFLPIALKLLDWTIKFMNWLNKSERLQKFIRWITIIGIVLGSVLFFIGMFGLGIGSILIAISAILTPIIMAIGAFFSFIGVLISATGWFGKIGSALLIFLGIIPAIRAASDDVKEHGGIWSMITGWIGKAISTIIGYLDGLWDKLLESEPIMKLMESMGLTAETIEAISNPIATVKKKLTELWQKIGGIFGITAEQTLAHPFEWLGQFLPTWLKIQKNKFADWLDELVPEDVSTKFDSLINSLETIANAVDMISKALGLLKSAWDGVSDFFDTIIEGIIKITRAAFPEGITPIPPKIEELQHGGIVTRPTAALIGESGPEAVIPLDELPSPGDMFRTPFEPTIKVIVENNTDAIVRIAPQGI